MNATPEPIFTVTTMELSNAHTQLADYREKQLSRLSRDQADLKRFKDDNATAHLISRAEYTVKYTQGRVDRVTAALELLGRLRVLPSRANPSVSIKVEWDGL